MKTSMTFLNDYVDMNGISAKEYADKMTMSGSKVESIENGGEEIKKVVAGKIISTEKHPDADKLQICQVDIGSETIQIVTGAKNIKAGDTVPVALHKSTLPGGVKITRGKLRGVMSNGMMCSHEELGLSLADYSGACEDGILIIQENVVPGTDIKEVLNLDENIIEFEITSNRADCFSVLGLARETAVTFGRSFNYKKPQVKASGGGNCSDMIDISITAPDLCPRYCARIVKNIKIAPSPKWLCDRLKSCGVRPINNIVDITNFVMLEYGQPMHAFDLEYLKEQKITVRRAAENEEITTLDGVARKLDSSMLVIADGKRPVAVAGVMGGENSEITENTKTILFESATFNGASVRLTAKKLGLRTEASSRYEKGLDANLTVVAVNRACELIEMLGAGDVIEGVADVCLSLPERRKIEFCPQKINKFLGCDIPKQFMTDILKSLDFIVDDSCCLPPTYRADVEGMADVAEEIARFYGYDKIPSTPLRGEATPGGKTEKQLAENKIRDILTGSGAYEISTYSFISPKEFDRISLAKNDEKRNVVKIQNPLGEETSVMRTTAAPSMLETLATNYNYRNADVKLFELGTIYIPQENKDLPLEKNVVCIGMYGNCDFYDLKGIIENLTYCFNISDVKYTPEKNNPTYHPGRCAKLMINGCDAGYLGEINPSVSGNYSVPTRTYLAEIDFNTLFENRNTEKTYRPLPKFPAVTRDIAVIADDSVMVAEISDIIKSTAGSILENVQLFDVYKGGQIPKNKKSVAFALTLRSAERTLTDDEIASVMTEIINNLASQLGVSLRE